jgi:hypothetical protein
MKITKIGGAHFDGFLGPAVHTSDLCGGRNLLLCGEDSSGKSSLNQLFNVESQAPSIGDCKRK